MMQPSLPYWRIDLQRVEQNQSRAQRADRHEQFLSLSPVGGLDPNRPTGRVSQSNVNDRHVNDRQNFVYSTGFRTAVKACRWFGVLQNGSTLRAYPRPPIINPCKFARPS